MAVSDGQQEVVVRYQDDFSSHFTSFFAVRLLGHPVDVFPSLEAQVLVVEVGIPKTPGDAVSAEGQTQIPDVLVIDFTTRAHLDRENCGICFKLDEDHTPPSHILRENLVEHPSGSKHCFSHPLREARSHLGLNSLRCVRVTGDSSRCGHSLHQMLNIIIRNHVGTHEVIPDTGNGVHGSMLFGVGLITGNLIFYSAGTTCHRVDRGCVVLSVLIGIFHRDPAPGTGWTPSWMWWAMIPCEINGDIIVLELQNLLYGVGELVDVLNCVLNFEVGIERLAVTILLDLHAVASR